jgi:hypothetical protein
VDSTAILDELRLLAGHPGSIYLDVPPIREESSLGDAAREHEYTTSGLQYRFEFDAGKWGTSGDFVVLRE